ncbi:hypothetical protein [Rhizobacter sp. P5_C2]
MGIYYYLYDRETAKGVCLGKRGRRFDAEFEGPTVCINGDQYLLPANLLQLLIDRFKASSSAHCVSILPDYELFDGADAILPAATPYTAIGGDVGPPLSIYLPELESEAGRAAVMQAGLRRA